MRLNIDAMTPDASSIPPEPTASAHTVRLRMLAVIEHLQHAVKELDNMPPSILGLVDRRMQTVVTHTHRIDRLGARFGQPRGGKAAS